MDLIENIKNMFLQVENRDDFYEKAANAFGVEKCTVRTNWFSRFEIPSKYNVRERLVTFMQNYIINQ